MPRWTKGTVVGSGVALVTVLAVVGWWVVPRVVPGLGVDATTASGPPPRLPDGPPREPRELLWSAPRSAEYRDVAVDGGYVVVGQGDGFAVRELLTGEQRWHYRVNGSILIRVAAGGGRVAAMFQLPGWDDGEDTVELRVFDLTTGQSLWSTRDLHQDVLLHLFPEVVVVEPFALAIPRLRAYRFADGSVAWSRDVSCGSGDETVSVDTGGGTFAVAVRCQGMVGVFDPASGRARWQHIGEGSQRLLAAGSDRVVTIGRGVDVPGLRTQYTLTGYAAGNGDRVGRSELRTNGLPTVAALADGWCAMTSEDAEVVDAVRCYDDDGRPRWTRRPGQVGDIYTFSDLRPDPNADVLVGLGPFGPFGASVAVLFDPDDGSSRLVELPEVHDAHEIVSFAHGALVVTGSTENARGRVFVYGEGRR